VAVFLLRFGTRGVWLCTDNTAWLGVLAILLIALRPVLTGAPIAAVAVIVPALVSVRQIHAWTIPFLILAMLTVSGTPPLPVWPPLFCPQ